MAPQPAPTCTPGSGAARTVRSLIPSTVPARSLQALRARPANPVTRPVSARARTQAAAASNSYHMLQYKYVPDILEKRGPYREKHLAGASAMVGGCCDRRHAAGTPLSGRGAWPGRGQAPELAHIRLTHLAALLAPVSAACGATTPPTRWPACRPMLRSWSWRGRWRSRWMGPYSSSGTPARRCGGMQRGEGGQQGRGGAVVVSQQPVAPPAAGWVRLQLGVVPVGHAGSPVGQ